MIVYESWQQEDRSEHPDSRPRKHVCRTAFLSDRQRQIWSMTTVVDDVGNHWCKNVTRSLRYGRQRCAWSQQFWTGFETWPVKLLYIRSDAGLSTEAKNKTSGWILDQLKGSKGSQCFSIWRTIPKIAHSPWGSGPSCNTWFLGPTQVSRPNGFSTNWAVFAWLTNVTNRQTHRHTHTDRPRY